jgi:phosphoribosylamine-glycine ligase
MKILLVSQYGDSLALFHRIMNEEGIDVIAYIEDKGSKHLYDGLLEKVDDFKDLLKIATKNDIFYFDFTKFGDAGKELQERGYKVFGGFKIADKLEQREYAVNINKRLKIKQPESYVFDNIEQAIRFIEETKKLYVVKSNDEYSISTFVPDNYYEESIIFLEGFNNANKIELQEKLNGVEVTLTLRFNKGMLIQDLMDSTIEEKRFLAGNLGVNTGCVSSIILPYKTIPPMFNKIVTFDFLQFIEDSKFTGIIDFNTMYMPDTDEYLFLEYTPRAGYNYEYVYRELLDVPYIQYLLKFTDDISTPVKMKDTLAGGLRITTPPSPFEGKEIEKIYKGKYITWSIKQVITNVYPLDALVKDEMLYTALPAMFEVTANGTLENIEKTIYAQAKEIIIPFKQYRIDAFERAKKHLPVILKANAIDNKNL